MRNRPCFSRHFGALLGWALLLVMVSLFAAGPLSPAEAGFQRMGGDVEEESLAPPPGAVPASESPYAAEEEEEDEEDEEEQSEVLGGGSRLERSEAGVLEVTSDPTGVKVFIDGEEIGVTPLEVQGLSDEAHEVILYHDDHGTFSQKVESGTGKIFVDLKAEAGMGVGFIEVATTPRDVRVDVDGKRVGLSPIRVPAVGGKHTVLLSREGYKDQELVVQVQPGETAKIEETLEEKDGAILVITSPSGGEIFLDDQSMGSAVGPMRISSVTPGAHRIRIEKAGYVTWEQRQVIVQRDKTETILAALHPETNESSVRIYSQPDGARVWLDGREVGVTGPDGLGFTTSKGAHILRLEVNPAVNPGFLPLQTSIAFNEDVVDFQDNPIQLPVVDEAFMSAQKLYERGESENAVAFLDRVDPNRSSFAESRIMMVDILKDLRRTNEIPGEFDKLFLQPVYKRNPVLNLAQGYWAILAARQATDREAAAYLNKAVEALDRCVESVDYFPAEDRQVMALKAHYYTGVASELLFGMTSEKKHVKKGVQAWEMFFARLQASDETLGNEWVEKAKQHQKNLLFLEKKLGG